MDTLKDKVLRDAEKLPELAGTLNGLHLLGLDSHSQDNITSANNYVEALRIIKELQAKLGEKKK